MSVPRGDMVSENYFPTTMIDQVDASDLVSVRNDIDVCRFTLKAPYKSSKRIVRRTRTYLDNGRYHSWIIDAIMVESAL